MAKRKISKMTFIWHPMPNMKDLSRFFDLYLESKKDLKKVAKFKHITVDEAYCLLERYRFWSANKSMPNGKKVYQHYIDIAREYERLNSYQAVGDLHGITRERVRQILRKGELLGLFTITADIQTPVERIQKVIDVSLLKSVSFPELARNAKISREDLHSFLQVVDPSYAKTIKDQLKENRKQRILAHIDIEYDAVSTSLKRKATATDLQHGGHAVLYAQILYRYGGIDEYRAYRGFPVHIVSRRKDIQRVNSFMNNLEVFEQRKQEIRSRYRQICTRYGHTISIFKGMGLEDPEERMVFRDIRRIWKNTENFLAWAKYED